MPHPAPEYAYRLPTDVALQIHDTAPPLVTMGSPRARLIVLVLTFGVLAGGLAATLPGGAAQAMPVQDCISWTHWENPNYQSDASTCE